MDIENKVGALLDGVSVASLENGLELPQHRFMNVRAGVSHAPVDRNGKSMRSVKAQVGSDPVGMQPVIQAMDLEVIIGGVRGVHVRQFGHKAAAVLILVARGMNVMIYACMVFPEGRKSNYSHQAHIGRQKHMREERLDNLRKRGTVAPEKAEAIRKKGKRHHQKPARTAVAFFRANQKRLKGTPDAFGRHKQPF